MRHVERLSIPRILVEKQEEWQAKFDAKRLTNPSVRPDSSKYGNPKIRERLEACSCGKCFYCESKLSDTQKEIDHFVEVSVAPERAYEWNNLYLSCSNCNDKLSHCEIPVEEVLDPCKDSDIMIRENITFEDECICSQPDSQMGVNTIKKFRLNSNLLDLKRGKWLQKIMKEALAIRKCMIDEGRKEATREEKRSLLKYMQPDQPYSLMSEIFLRKNFRHLFV